jgi:hypothetical protein
LSQADVPEALAWALVGDLFLRAKVEGLVRAAGLVPRFFSTPAELAAALARETGPAADTSPPVLIVLDLSDRAGLGFLALESLPEGIPFVLCPNDSKEEMAEKLNDAFHNKVETDYVFIMGADDALDPDCLRFLCESIGTADVAYPTLVDYDIYSQNRIRRTRKDPEQWPRLKAEADAAGLNLDEIAPGDEPQDETVLEAEPPAMWGLQDMNFLPGAFLAKTETLRRFPQPELLVEDWAWHFHAMMRGVRYVPVRDAKYLYRLRHDSLTNRIDEAVAKAYDGDKGPIRRAVRRYVWQDIYTAEGDDPEGRVPIAASFQVSSSETQAFVRAVLPARYLPGVGLSPELIVTADLEEALADASLVVLAVPSHALREVVTRADAWARGGVAPHLTLLLDCPVRVGLQRARGENDRFHAEEEAFHERVRAGFHALVVLDAEFDYGSAHARADRVDEAVNLGVSGYLTKPFRVPRVLAAASKALGE